MAAAAVKLVGKLTINVVAGKNLKDMELIGKMDPYVTLKCGKEEFKTKVQKKAGTNPTFNQSFIFNLEGKEEALHLNALDEDMVSDDHIGRCDIPLDKLVQTDKPVAYQLVSKTDFKKITGELILKCESFVGTGAPNPAAKAAAAAAPAPAAAAAAAPQQQVVYQQPMAMGYAPQQQYMAGGAQPQYMAGGAQPRVVKMAAPQQPQLVQGADGKLYAIQQPQQQVVYMQAQPQVVYMQPQGK